MYSTDVKIMVPFIKSKSKRRSQCIKLEMTKNTFGKYKGRNKKNASTNCFEKIILEIMYTIRFTNINFT